VLGLGRQGFEKKGFRQSGWALRRYQFYRSSKRKKSRDQTEAGIREKRGREGGRKTCSRCSVSSIPSSVLGSLTPGSVRAVTRNGRSLKGDENASALLRSRPKKNTWLSSNSGRGGRRGTISFKGREGTSGLDPLHLAIDGPQKRR